MNLKMKLKQKEKQIQTFKEWEYHQPELIEQIIQQENIQNECKVTQRKIILNKINMIAALNGSAALTSFELVTE